MAQKNDQIFQLSLTELAFTIIFLLMLLLGYLVHMEQTARLAAETELSQVRSLEQATASLESAKSSFAAQIKRSPTLSPDEVISTLIAQGDVRKERDILQSRVDDLDAKLTALTAIQNEIEKLSKSDGKDLTKEKIESALALQEKVLQSFSEPAPHTQNNSPSQKPPPSKPNSKELLDKVKQALDVTQELKSQLKAKMDIDLKSGEASQHIKDMVSAAKRYSDLSRQTGSPEQARKENADLRGQVAFLKNKLDARGGRDYPPCWADEKTGKVEFLFSVEVRPSNVVVTPEWPAHRESDARALPGLAAILAGSPLSYPNFVSSIQGIYKSSVDLQCRHYVLLKSSISDAVESDRARLLVENYFYKAEVRR